MTTISYREKYLKILTEIKALALDSYGDRLISLVVFGSVANDRFSPESDIDILFILNGISNSFNEYCYFYNNIEEKIPNKGNVIINPIFRSKERLSEHFSILWNTNFILLFDRDGFFTKFIKRLEDFKRENLVIRDNYIEIASN